jgi:hypothetical protein
MLRSALRGLIERETKMCRGGVQVREREVIVRKCKGDGMQALERHAR